MKKILFSLAAGTAFVAVPAMAQDVGPVQPFTGGHVEGVIGYDTTRAGSSTDVDPNEPNNRSIDGFMYGVGAGWDFRSNNIVFGPEAEVTWSTAKTKFDDGQFENFGIGHVKTNRDLYVGAKVGYVVSPKTMVYLKGGYTNAKFDVLNGDGTSTFNRDIDTDGFRVGAGVEQEITNNTFVKLEYRFSKYKKAELDYSGDIPDSQRFDVDFNRHQVAAAVGVRF